MKLKWLKPEIIATILASILIFKILMLPPITGLADNGDFGRSLASVGLIPFHTDAQDFFGFIRTKYIASSLGFFRGLYVTTQWIPLGIASGIAINFLYSVFDIRILSAIYAVLFLIALFILVKYGLTSNQTAKWITSVFAVLILVDVGYVAYFNSLYGEATIYVFMLLWLSLGMYIIRQEYHSVNTLILYFVSAIMFVGAKQQNIPIAFIVILFSLGLYRLRKDSQWKKIVTWGLISIVLVSTIIGLTITKEIKQINIFQAVFIGVLLESPTPKQDLIQLGLDPDFSVLANRTYYDNDLPIALNSPKMQIDFFERISYSNILKFYLSHPNRLYKMLQISSQSAFNTRPGYLGNFPRQDGISYQQKSNFFCAWSSFKSKTLMSKINSYAFMFIVIFYLLFAAGWFNFYLKEKNISNKIYLELVATIALIGLISLPLPYLADGAGDLEKHLFMFNVCFDIIILLTIGEILSSFISYWRNASCRKSD